MKKSVCVIAGCLLAANVMAAALETFGTKEEGKTGLKSLVSKLNSNFVAVTNGTTTIRLSGLTVNGATSLSNTTIQAGSTLSTGSGLTTIGAGGLTVNGASSLSNTTIQAGSTLSTGSGLTTIGAGGLTVNGASSLTNTTIRPGSTLTVGGNLGLSQIVTNIAVGVTNLMYFYNGVLTNVSYAPVL